ncbi:MAG: hypothetical protein A3E94_03630 [Candidatus Zambryskibacteria bacterium RIFCSPHIGHO2_12_FULL_44_12b]|nr:MAG: hypothetical protein A3E94_03630 [Candidatus Zambryskibacteria bacterium RIFCSPHIGHO2_12_FULL_44_12b]
MVMGSGESGAKTSGKRIFELYLHPDQKEYDWVVIKGFELDKHLRGAGLYERTLSLKDKEVKRWLGHPVTYPEEYKDKAIYLWKSQQDVGGYREVACLIWYDERVVVISRWLDYYWSGDSPVLLAPEE